MVQTRRGLLRRLGAGAVGAGVVSTVGTGTAAADAAPSLNWRPADSSNYTADSRSAANIRWFLVHVAEGTHEGTVSWFQDSRADASTHYSVENAADPAAARMVDESDTCWHAGNWGYNETSLGIEHGGYTGETTFVDGLYDQSARIAAWAAERFDFPLRVRRYDVAPCDAYTGGEGGVIGHDQVPDPDNCSSGGGSGAHSDPGSTWNWGRYEGYLRREHIGVGGAAVTSADLTVRASPSLSGSVLATAPTGETGTVVDGPVDADGYRWWEVDYDGTTTGWSASDWLLYSRFGAGDGVQTTSGLSVRDAPGLSSSTIDTAWSGESGTVVGGPVDADGYRWFEVDYSSTATGWSAGYWLR